MQRSRLKETGISKADSLVIGKSMYSIFKDFFNEPFFKKDVCKIQNIVVKKMGETKRLPADQLLNCYKNYLIDQKMLNKFHWCDLYKKSDYGVY
jgi:hypothetical protein